MRVFAPNATLASLEKRVEGILLPENGRPVCGSTGRQGKFLLRFVVQPAVPYAGKFKLEKSPFNSVMPGTVAPMLVPFLIRHPS